MSKVIDQLLYIYKKYHYYISNNNYENN